MQSLFKLFPIMFVEELFGTLMCVRGSLILSESELMGVWDWFVLGVLRALDLAKGINRFGVNFLCN